MCQMFHTVYITYFNSGDPHVLYDNRRESASFIDRSLVHVVPLVKIFKYLSVEAAVTTNHRQYSLFIDDRMMA